MVLHSAIVLWSFIASPVVIVVFHTLVRAFEINNRRCLNTILSVLNKLITFELLINFGDNWYE